MFNTWNVLFSKWNGMFITFSSWNAMFITWTLMFITWNVRFTRQRPLDLYSGMFQQEISQQNQTAGTGIAAKPMTLISFCGCPLSYLSFIYTF